MGCAKGQPSRKGRCRPKRTEKYERGTILILTKLFGNFLFDNFGRCPKLLQKMKFREAKEFEKQ